MNLASGLYINEPRIILTKRGFDPDKIVTASIEIIGIDQSLYTGNELYLVVADNDGNVVTLC